jgi:outer membrane protein assembly factor BamE (lipoprotein component of BamABCDE complex)
VLKIALGVILGGILLIAGSATVCAVGTGSYTENVKQKRAITNRQAQAIPLGTSKAEVIDQLGRPRTTQEGKSEVFGDCIYYDVRGGDERQFCFDASDHLVWDRRIRKGP